MQTDDKVTTMHVHIKLFATLKERAGKPELGLELPPASTVADLKQALGRDLPGLAQALPSALISVNHEYAFDQDALKDGDEVALFPPVSGG